MSSHLMKVSNVIIQSFSTYSYLKKFQNEVNQIHFQVELTFILVTLLQSLLCLMRLSWMN